MNWHKILNMFRSPREVWMEERITELELNLAEIIRQNHAIIDDGNRTQEALRIARKGAQTWVNVKDRVPGKDDPADAMYLVVYEHADGHRSIDIQHLSEHTHSLYDWHTNLSDGNDFTLVRRKARRVTHWMPLPELP